jgi:FAD/FMN-containing dehydrogenase
MRAMLRPPDLATLERLKQIVGPPGLVPDPADVAPYLREWRNRWVGETPLLLCPGSTDEVAAIMRACHAADVGVVPQGGNTGLVGGQIPRAGQGEVLISLRRMNRIRRIDPVDGSVTAEAGCTLAAVQAAAAGADRLFPLSLAAEGTCQIGGNLSTNAGGIHVLRYGNARDLVLGLEVVNPDGSVWNGLRALRKDNTGYDLKHLFLGAEGTLGIITAAVLKLFPRHRQVETILAAVPNLEAAVALLSFVRDASHDAVLAFELICRTAMEFVTRNVPGTTNPLTAPAPWYVLFDLTSSRSIAEETVAAAQTAGLVTDAVLAASAAQATALWRLREAISESQKPEGASIKHDISVPVSRIPTLVEKVLAAAPTVIPGIRPVPFGHVGDGNLHFNFSQPIGMDPKAFMARGEDLHLVVHDLTVAEGGSISAEHGIGLAKRDEIQRYKTPVELALMRAIKTALDPKGIMNPGKGVV